ncbi:MAG: hypothetical protein O6761_04380 [Thaumarchaeota archaeon]|nr:hypothetical protein [Nitrososphaerota archaeon]
MQQISSTKDLKNRIIELLNSNGMDSPCYSKMLDYTIKLFESNGLGHDYYGYHNIDHELEVTYVTLLASQWNSISGLFTKEDMQYLYTAALFHDFDPEKSVDKPHEDAVLQFLKSDENLRSLLTDAKLDLKIIEALILRTTYPWSGQLKQNAEKQIDQCFQESEITRTDTKKQEHYKKMGWFLSIVDRVSGYTLGDFTKAMEMAKKNAHALAWHPEVIVRSSVVYFDVLLHKEADMCEQVLRAIPRDMRKNFMDNVLSFLKLREKEIQIKMSYIYDNMKLFPVIEPVSRRQDAEFLKSLREVFDQLPSPLQFKKDSFEESVKESSTLVNTLRLGNENGPIIGYAKGGPLEKYTLRPEVKDENYGKYNTAFLEPLAIREGYWGLRGGREIRLLFTLQAYAKRYTYVTSFALRDVIQRRIKKSDTIDFVTHIDPERWDYYRIKL